jgi:hypothetical protein
LTTTPSRSIVEPGGRIYPGNLGKRFLAASGHIANCEGMGDACGGLVSIAAIAASLKDRSEVVQRGQIRIRVNACVSLTAFLCIFITTIITCGNAQAKENLRQYEVLLFAQLAGPGCYQCRQECARRHEQGDQQCCLNNGGVPSGGSCNNPSNRERFLSCLRQVEDRHSQCFDNCQPTCDAGR